MGSSYTTAVGVKFYPGSITVKHFVGDNHALEGLFSFWDHGFRFTGLYEIHGNITDAKGLKWYIGPGAHIGAYNEDWSHGDHHYPSGGFSLGIDGVVGLDYKFQDAPINISLDLQPSLEFIENPYLSLWGGIAVRYTF